MKYALAVLFTLMLAGCSGGGDESDSDDGTNTGYLTMDGIAGLPYRTASQSGVTDGKGRFKYRTGETISFYLGDIDLAADIPTKKYLTLIDFSQEEVAAIDQGTQYRGMTDHTELETNAAEDPTLINKTRLLMSLNDPDEDSDNDPLITISREIRDAAEAYVDAGSIDFSQSTGVFGDKEEPGRAENQFINAMCEAIEGIECAGNDVKTMTNSEVAKGILTSQAEAVTTHIISNIFLNPRIIEIDASDTRIHDVKISSVGVSLNIVDIEVAPLDELPDSEGNFPDNPRTVVAIQSASASGRSFSFYSVGEAGQETSIVVNFKLAGDYRWYRKTLRVRLN